MQPICIIICTFIRKYDLKISEHLIQKGKVNTKRVEIIIRDKEILMKWKIECSKISLKQKLYL